jgi:hypothetical protein
MGCMCRRYTFTDNINIEHASGTCLLVAAPSTVSMIEIVNKQVPAVKPMNLWIFLPTARNA